MDIPGRIKIIESPYLPSRASNYVLAPGDYISDEYRAKMQAWCDEFFGTHAVAYLVDLSSVGIPGGQFVGINPANAAMVRFD